MKFKIRSWSSVVVLAATAGLILANAPLAFAATKIDISTHQGQSSPSGTYGSGSVTTYSELDEINFRFTLEATDATPGGASGTMKIEFTGVETQCLFFLQSFTLGTHNLPNLSIEPISGVPPIVTAGTLVQGSGPDTDEWIQTLSVTFAGNGKATIYYHLQLSDEAGECNGASQHSRMGAVTGDFQNPGAQNVPVPANQLVELPDITVIKRIDRDGNGSFESTAGRDEYCFTLDTGLCINTDDNGRVVFAGVSDGNHAITETELNIPTMFEFKSGSGANCTFDVATATATANVAKGTTARNATCTFNNGPPGSPPPPGNATLTVKKVVVNDEDGQLDPGDFTIHVTTGGNPVDSSPGSQSGTVHTLPPGTYVVSEDPDPDGVYTPTFSGDCDSGGSVMLTAGDNKECTITNDDSDVPSAGIEVTKIPSQASITAPGGNVTFTVQVHNPSTVDVVTIVTLTDDKFGNLHNQGTCSVPQIIAPLGTYTCTFTGAVTGNAGDTHENKVTATGVDDDGVAVDDEDTAGVRITEPSPTGGGGAVGGTVGGDSVVAAAATCLDLVATIVGGPGDSIINGTPGNDVIVDLTGNNTVRGGGGDDVICTGPGNDDIATGNGNDLVIDFGGVNRIHVAGGNDTIDARGDNVIFAGPGADKIKVYNGDNRIRTFSGHDLVRAGNGDNFIRTGGGKDRVFTGNGDNDIGTHHGRDRVRTGSGDDFIRLNKGNDIGRAGKGDNVLRGGRGNDRLVARKGDDLLNGMHGVDTCRPGGGNNTLKNCEK